MNLRHTAALSFTVLLALAAGSASAQRSSVAVGINTVAAPVPDPILHGKRAFISYEIGDVTAFPSVYSGGPERAYQEFYTQMAAWGRYQLVGDPKDADLVLAVRFVDAASPQIRVGVMSPGGRVSLWGFVEPINLALRKRNRDADFTLCVKQLISDMKMLLSTAPAAPNSAP